jgi:starch phosphorylase
MPSPPGASSGSSRNTSWSRAPSGTSLRRFERDHGDWGALAAKVAIQLNDTHPSLAIAELMRLLMDERDVEWDAAWRITQATIAYTNHTLASEALERWSVPLLERVIPRHLQIIFEINRRLLESVAIAHPNDPDRLRNVSLVEESDPKQVRMAHLAVVGSHSVNGVSAVHSELLRARLLGPFADLWPERFRNVTNGISQRAWLLDANPPLARLVTSTIGDEWITNLDALRALETWASDAGFRAAFRAVKRTNKERLARVIQDRTAVIVDVDSMFDVQAKRIHAYKRQLLNVMHIVLEYLTLVEDGRAPTAPRTYVFAGKAAPGYALAKAIIKLIHCVARVIDGDARARGWIRVAFVPDYNVSLAAKLIPAGDLSEQISTAGTEASGTGNMKFALSGAVTIGTLDGANLEIRHQVGAENMFAFGLTADEVETLRARGAYRPREIYEHDARVRRVVDALRTDLFCREDRGLFAWVEQLLLNDGDEFVHLADFPGYLDAHARAAEAFVDRDRWDRMAILNVARIGRFSSDRSVREYARDVWGIAAC